MEDELRIGYDGGNERGDVSCLMVMRKKGRGYEVVKIFYKEEAEILYKRLTERNDNLEVDCESKRY
ncbi:hypothetical protein [Hungatella effluvii]|uniref:hypothetical protein n=1 Tax=Hungatella effluvii TaxID=1096246 RepID=UPI002A80D918|nr:hypothetical protein [Hungatella effluvii]